MMTPVGTCGSPDCPINLYTHFAIALLRCNLGPTENYAWRCCDGALAREIWPHPQRPKQARAGQSAAASWMRSFVHGWPVWPVAASSWFAQPRLAGRVPVKGNLSRRQVQTWQATPNTQGALYKSTSASDSAPQHLFTVQPWRTSLAPNPHSSVSQKSILALLPVRRYALFHLNSSRVTADPDVLVYSRRVNYGHIDGQNSLKLS